MEYGVSLMVNASPIGPGRSDEHLWSTMGLMGEGPSVRAKSGSRVNSKTAMGYPPLYRAINLIASSVAGLPFDVFRRQRGGGKKVDNRHPAQILLDKKASSYMNAYTFRRTRRRLRCCMAIHLRRSIVSMAVRIRWQFGIRKTRWCERMKAGSGISPMLAARLCESLRKTCCTFAASVLTVLSDTRFWN